MHSRYIVIGVLLAVFGRLGAQNPDKSSFNYTQSWSQVDTLDKKGLNTSALELIAKIRKTANAEKNAAQVVKTYIYQIRLAEQMEEEATPQNIRLLETEIGTAFFPLKPMLQSIVAGEYWKYYQQSLYRSGNRSTTTNFKNDDITTWSLQQLVEKAVEHYQLSLSDAGKLKKTPIGVFREVLTGGNKIGKANRPTLYDFLAHEAVDFFTNNEPDLTKPAFSFSISSPDYFSDAASFINLNISTRDTFAYKYFALKLFQDLLRFHLNDPTPNALIDVDLKRLDFVYQYSTLQNKDELMFAALETLEEKHKSHPASAWVSVRIAKVWNQNANRYNPLQSDEHKWDRKKAYDICSSVIKRFPGTGGAAQAYNLQQEIKTKTIDAEIEKVNIPGQPFRALVGYRNFTNLFWRAVPVTYYELVALREKWERKYDIDQEEMLLKYLLSKSPAQTGKFVLPPDSDFNRHSVEIGIDALSKGSYCILFSNNGKFVLQNNVISYAFTTVSNLAWFHRNRDNGSSDLFVVDRTTGEPVGDARVQLLMREYNEQKSIYELIKGSNFQTDPSGYVDIPFQYDNYVRSYGAFEFSISAVNDTIWSFDLNNLNWNGYGHFYQSERREIPRRERTIFFLDRAIYRPGQPLYYKGLLVDTDGKTPVIIPDRKLTVTFYDVNAQVVGRQQVITNNYGTFSGTFTTPSSGLLGSMHLSVNDNTNSTTYFRVEEYKRPKFEVKFDPVKGAFKFGEKVNITGKAVAYSGAIIDGAAVQYRVVRRAVFPFWWWCWFGYYPPSPDMEIVSGKDTTAADGSFSIDFTAIPDASVPPKSSPTFVFEVTADVTDINGETHSTSTSVSIGYKALMLGVEVKDVNKNNADTVQFGIKTTNLSGEFEPATGSITIWKLKSPEKPFRERFWERPDKFLYTRQEFYNLFPYDPYNEENNFYKWEKQQEVLGRTFDTSKDKKLTITNFKEWPEGKYLLQIDSKDKYGEAVKEVAYFEVMDNVGAPAIPSVFTVKDIKTTAEPGEKAMVEAASSEKVKYLYEVERDGKILEQQWLSADNEQNMIEIPIKEEYRGNIAVHLITVKNNRMYSTARVIVVPYSNKKLDIKFETFRDKLLPGQEEQWKIKVSSKYADKTMAEMVATLYDASLDAFVAHSWHADLYNSFYARLWWQSLNGFGSYRFNEFDRNWNNFRFKDVLMPEYQQLRWNYGHRQYVLEMQLSEEDAPAFMIMEESAAYEAPPPPQVDVRKGMRLKKGENVAGFVPPAVEKELADTLVVEDLPLNSRIKQDFSEVKVRKNFNETAFFYPHLQTNAQGEIVISFTIPEALTRWKMLGFAHTTDLKSGLIQNELVTQKDLMVVPNQPRFFRENDKMIFQAKVNCLVDKDIEGQARLEFFDALTMQPVDALLKNSSNIKDFKLKARQSTNLEWSIEIPEGLQALTYRIVARSGEFSDGEEMTLPVVTNRTLVTESLPLLVRGKQTKEFTFEKLVNNTSTTLRNHRFTLEFTSNPAWYAIQALPYLMEYPYECTEQTFSRFYANSIATHIANSNPKIKHVFDTWSNIQPDALLSNLEKNQELKTALLQETPWVLNAKSESQRKRNIALLFDLNRMANEQEKAMKKILEAQLSNGGFSWFPGLPEDLYITQYIVSGIGHLETMGVKYKTPSGKINNMLQRAMAYMDLKMKERYDYLKAEAKKEHLKLEDNQLGYYEIQYLYARSYFKNIAIPDTYKDAFGYWLQQAEKYWLKQNNYAQGMIALALKRYDKPTVAMDIVKSLKERSLNSEEMGMYWKINRGYYWYEAPVETQALMIEVFDEVTGDTKAVEDMKVWLLKQKQTQDWETTKATSDACYALLRRGTDLLVSDKLVEITVGDEKIDPAKRDDTKVEAGTGYFKTSWTAPEIKPEMGHIKVKKTDEGVAWGAAYWQYFEQLDKITGAETPLKISKKLFKEVNTDRGPVITPADSSILKPGDVIKVRIELRADRTMEYIHLKDMRASAFEPVDVLSGYKYQDGLWYYQSPGDLATNFFIGWLPKGTYVFEYTLRVSQVGDFSNGITTIQCMYAPEFSSHSEGVRVKVVK